MGWQKRDLTSDLVILGDGEGNAKKIGGLLAAVNPDPRYPDNRRFSLVQKDGSVKTVAGSAAINSQLGEGDIGRFVKLSFTGWGSSRNGKFKEIEVEVYEGEGTDEMKAWPQYAELQNRGKTKTEPAPEKKGVTESDNLDDLPF